MSKKETFFQWLQKHRNTDTPEGDLARASRLDKNYPKQDTLEAWQEYIFNMGGSFTVIDLLQDTWIQYQQGAIPEDAKIKYRLSSDDLWTIRRPRLPNFIGPFPSLLQVRCTALKDNESFEIRVASGRIFRDAVEQLGRYFRREFSYDFLPYTAREHERVGDGTLQAYLLFDPVEVRDVVLRPIGACSFLLRQDRWMMNWIWLHPFARRRGHLTKAWQFFHKCYNNFDVQHPLSSAMESFLYKINGSTQQISSE